MAAAFAWHANALKGVYGNEIVAHFDEPECGFFKRRLVKDGPFVPARIWLDQEIDPATGELLADERLQCEVAGEWRDPHEEWPWLCGNPIGEAEFNYLTAAHEWSVAYAPGEPFAHPRQPVDWLKVPTPRFT